MLRRILPVPLPAGMLLGGALIALAALLLVSASEKPESVAAQVCEGEEVPLVAGCQIVTSTFEDDTPIETIAGCVSPPEILIAIWKVDAGTGTWLGYSPQFPEVSDLTKMDLLEGSFFCLDAPGTFTRPVL